MPQVAVRAALRQAGRWLCLLLLALLPLLATRPAPAYAVPAGPFAYIPNFQSNTVSVIDTSTNTVATTVAMPTLPDSAPDGVAINPSGTRVYVSNFVDVSVSVLDTSTNTVVATVPLGGDTVFPEGLAVNPAGTRVYVASGLKLSVIDASSNTVVAAVSGRFAGDGVAVNPDGSRVYIGSGFGRGILIMDTSTNAIVGTVPLDRAPGGIAVSPDGTRIYVATGNHLAVIDTSSNAVLTSIAIGQGPIGVAVNPAGNRVYVANGGSNTVSVVDTASNSVLATIPVGSNPFGVSTTSDGSRVYVANRSSNTVSAIDAFTNAVVATIPVGNTPTAFGQFVQPSTAPAATAVALASSQNLALFGTAITLTAGVTTFAAAPPSGFVSFWDGQTPLGSAPVVPSAGGAVAQLTTATLTPGSHTITAVYAGDANHAEASSGPLSQLVQAAGASPASPPPILVINGFTLSFAVQGCGSITPPGEQGFHFFGDTMLLSAVPCAGSAFTGWLSGPCAGTTSNPCAVAMPPNDLTITAGFNP